VVTVLTFKFTLVPAMAVAVVRGFGSDHAA